MKYIYFTERNGVKYYKLDTFWSSSDDISRSKIYSTIDKDLLNSYVYNIEMWAQNRYDKFLEHYKDYHHSSLGYQIIEDDQVNPDNEYILIDNPVPKDTVYLYTMNVYEDGKAELTDYKKVNRERKIKSILSTKNNG